MSRRYYSSTAVPTTLSSSITDSGTTLSLAASTGFPASYPFTLILDENTAYEEVVTVTAALGSNQFTITRGSDGTTAQAHSGGAAARHGFSKRDLDEPNEHINSSAGVHGVVGSVIGSTDAQVMTNKTLTSPTITTPTLTLKQSTSPTPTAEGDIQWDTDGDKLVIGDGSGQKVISPDNVTATLENKTLSGATLSSPTITTPTIASFTNATHDHSNAAGGGNVPVTSITGLVGSITAYAGSSAPTGFLLCDGSAVSRSTYATLFALIGTTYGSGDGSTTFNVPNLKGKMPVGYNASDAAFDALGETGGAKTATLTTTELPAHTHSFSATTSTDGSHQHGQSWELSGELAGSGNTLMTSDGSGTAYTVAAGSHSHTVSGTTGSNGSGSAFSILNPYIALNFIIKH